MANRGEIAVRVMRTAKAMGSKPLPSTQTPMPMLCMCVPPIWRCPCGNTAAESYLNGEAILEAARKTGADAIHPGYGFYPRTPGLRRPVQGRHYLYWPAGGGRRNHG